MSDSSGSRDERRASRNDGALKRQLGLAAVVALVAGNMLGSGVFFTPGELAAVAQHPWQVHFIWALCGLITLCGALTLAELCRLLPHAGATYHVLREGYSPLWGFVLVWMELWVSGPGSVAGIAIAFGEFMQRVVGSSIEIAPVWWGAAAIAFFAAINLAGVNWGGRVQVHVTTVKVAGIVALIAGALFLAAPTGASVSAPTAAPDGSGPLAFFRFVGLGVAAVLFTYDGWIDVSHVAGEVRRPGRDLPLGMAIGVGALTLLYLAVNVAFLRVIPLAQMRAAPATIASTVATAAYGSRGGPWLDVLMMVSIFGALGGLVMTLPRLFYTMAEAHAAESRGALRWFFARMGRVASRTATPNIAILFTAATSIAALLFFGSFSRLVNFFVVPFQAMNILMVAAIFRLRRRYPESSGYRTPGYPFTPVVYIVVMVAFLVSAVAARALETLIGTALAMTGIPVYWWLVHVKSSHK
ncbi:MAG: amino acid permease [Gemmatimonadaceae bacterium]|nr:amino acid permease [Gemmatimonadaceae bacterium]